MATHMHPAIAQPTMAMALISPAVSAQVDTDRSQCPCYIAALTVHLIRCITIAGQDQSRYARTRRGAAA